MAIQPVPSMTPVPNFPALSERAAGTYNASAYAFGHHMSVTFNGELLAVANNVKNNAQYAYEQTLLTHNDRLATDLSRAAAEAAAASAINAPGTSASSSSSMTIALGDKSFVIQPGKAFSLGQSVVIAQTAAPGNQMIGIVTAHNSATGAMTVSVSQIFGAGSAIDWTVSLGAMPGSYGLAYSPQTGATGTIANGQQKGMVNVAASTITLPTDPAEGDFVIVTVANGLLTNTIDPGSKSIVGPSGLVLSGPMTINKITTVALRYINGIWRIQ